MKVSFKNLTKFYYLSLFNDSLYRKDLSTFLPDSAVFTLAPILLNLQSHTQEVIQNTNCTIQP